VVVMVVDGITTDELRTCPSPMTTWSWDLKRVAQHQRCKWWVASALCLVATDFVFWVLQRPHIMCMLICLLQWSRCTVHGEAALGIPSLFLFTQMEEWNVW